VLRERLRAAQYLPLAQARWALLYQVERWPAHRALLMVHQQVVLARQQARLEAQLVAAAQVRPLRLERALWRW